MRDKVFIVIGILSLIIMLLELLDTIPETYGWIAFLGWMMFIFNAVNTSRQKTNEILTNLIIIIHFLYR